MKYLLAVLFHFVLVCSLQAGDSYYYFKQISIREGLPSSVTAIHDDEGGFLWIGTIYGAYRFDGEKLKKCTFPSERQASPYVFEILNDNERRIWTFTNQGVNLYNPSEDTFELFPSKGNPVSAYTLVADGDRVVLPIKGELLSYDKELKNCIRIPVRYQGEPVLLLKVAIYDPQYYLGLTYEHTLILVDRKTGETRTAPFDAGNQVWDFFRDSENRYWIAMYGTGIACYSLSGKLIDTYTPANSGLNNTAILDIEERNRQIWLATDGGGINIVNPANRQISTLTNQENRHFPANSVTCLNNGKNNMWVGMVREGVLGAKENFITSYSRSAGKASFGLSEKCPLCLVEDTDGTIWIGTDGGGVNSFNPQAEQFTHYPSTAGDKIVSMCLFSEDELLISNYLTGVHLFNKRTGHCRKFTIVDSRTDSEMVGSGTSINLRVNSLGEIELHGVGYYRYLKAQNRFIPLRAPQPKYNGSWIHIGDHQSMPYYFNSGNVFRYNYLTDCVESIYENSVRHIIAAVLDKNDMLWVAGHDNLTTFNLRTRELTPVKLPDNNDLVTSLVVDRQGTVWMGTPGALYAYHPAEKHFVIYSESDGVMPNDFLPKPVLVTRDDNVYMGGAMGLVRVNKAFYHGDDRNDNLQLNLLDLQLNGTSVLPTYEQGISELEIPSNFTSLEVHLKLEGGDLFRKCIYRYQIEGLNEDYVESSKPYLKLQTLLPGEYRIHVQCTMSNGLWSPTFTLLHLTVLPPWWQRTWFIALVALLLVAGAVYVIRLREVRIQHELQEKERQIYKDKVKALININHELLTPLTLIYSPLKQLLNSRQIPYELRGKLQGTFKQARRMKNVIQMILNMRRMEVGQNVLSLTSTKLNDWLQNIISDFDAEFQMRNISLQFNPDTQIDSISFDAGQCEIVVNNLLMNAYKFSSPDSVITVSTHLEGNGEFVRIEVCDQGIGLGNEDPQKLFVRFQRGNHGIEGNGIGLSYAKQLVEMHGGQINAKNNTERGATFYFTLPVHQEAGRVSCPAKPYLNEFVPEVTAPQVQEVQETAQLAKFHSILIVESDPDLCDFMAANLQAIFEKTYVAHDGMEALPVVVSQLPQIIICDVKLPRISGLELCRRVKQNPELNFIPVILLAPDMDVMNTDGYKTGADACVEKPFDMDLLMTQVQNMLNNRNIIRKRYQTTPNTDKLSGVKAGNYIEEQFVIHLNKVIAENLSNTELDVNMVAKLMRMSRASLYSKMKTIMGVGVNEYITKQRIRYTEEQLITTDLSIREISEQAGFLHQRNFSATFKGITGYSPTDYRKNKLSPESLKGDEE